MHKISFILILLFFIPGFLLSQESKTDYEYKVLNEVFDELIDSMHVFITYPEMPPPPPPASSDSVSSKLSELRENENYKKRVRFYEKKLEKLRADKNVIATRCRSI